MFNKIIKASDGTVLALTEDVTYIKKADNGCYILCPEPDASGISYAGTPYHLFGRKPLDDAESVILEPTDIGGWIMGAKAAIEDADEIFLSTPSARRATAKTETKSLFSNKLYNILHEFRRALIYNGSKSYPNHAK